MRYSVVMKFSFTPEPQMPLAAIGGKGTKLLHLQKHWRVPEWFVVTSEMFRHCLVAAGMEKSIGDLLAQVSEENCDDIAEKISTNVHITTPEKRRHLHLAAVFACNFTNHLWTISEDLLNEKDIPFDLLKPLIHQTFLKIQNHSPKNVQTGPAVRNDLKTLEKHRKILSECRDALQCVSTTEIYNILSKSIQNTHGSHR